MAGRVWSGRNKRQTELIDERRFFHLVLNLQWSEQSIFLCRCNFRGISAVNIFSIADELLAEKCGSVGTLQNGGIVQIPVQHVAAQRPATLNFGHTKATERFAE